MTQLQRLAIAPAQLVDRRLTLTPEQQHYLNRVLRLQSGDRFIAMDGLGHWWLAQLADSPTAEIIEAMAADMELPQAIALQIAIPKGSGMDEIVRQATELGVNYITPILSDRTLLQPSPQKLERWRRIAQEAAEQSERQIVPTIQEPIPWAKILQHRQTGQAYLCVARQSVASGSVPLFIDCLRAGHTNTTGHQNITGHQDITGQQDIIIATGPEGGWTNTEVEAAIAAGYQPVSLGRRILRAVTAPIAALSLVAALLETQHQAKNLTNA